MVYTHPIGIIYRVYTRYILPSRGLYHPYHLLQEPEKSIDKKRGETVSLIPSAAILALPRSIAIAKSSFMEIWGAQPPPPMPPHQKIMALLRDHYWMMVVPMVANNPMKVSEVFSTFLVNMFNSSSSEHVNISQVLRSCSRKSSGVVSCFKKKYNMYNATQKQTCGMWISILHPPATYWNTWTLRHLLECSKWRLY